MMNIITNKIDSDLVKITLKRLLNEKSHNCDPEFRALCEFKGCSLHDYCTKKMVRKSMIRRFCFIDYMHNLRAEVQLCPSTDCPFYPFKMCWNA